MMKILLHLCLSFFLCAGMLFADNVELRDGTVIEGTILSENPDSIEIQIGINERGTIHRILRIHASEISSWSSDKPRAAGEDAGGGMIAVSGAEHVEGMLREAEAKMQDRQLDEGIAGFAGAADAAVGNLEQLGPEEQAKALNLRVHALRLQLAAMEGKVTMLEHEMEGVRDRLDERLSKLERDEEKLENRKSDYNRDRKSSGVDIRTRQIYNDLASVEKELKSRRAALTREQAALGYRVRELEAEKVRTETQMVLVEERVDRAEDKAKAAERNARGR